MSQTQDSPATADRLLNIDDILAIAVFHHQNGNIAAAKGLYEAILLRAPNNDTCVNNLGLIAGLEGDLALAEKLHKQAIASNPYQEGAYVNLGNLAKSRQQSDAAIAYFQQALSINPHSEGALVNLGIAFSDLGRIDKALAYFRRALVANAQSVEGYISLGNMLTCMQKAYIASQCYERAITLSPASPAAHTNLGAALRNMGHYTRSLISFERAMRLNPDNLEAKLNMGNVLADLGRIDEAIEYYERIFSVRPEHPGAISNTLFALNYSDRITAAELAQKHFLIGGKIEKGSPLPSPAPRAPSDIARKLRIGYISPDFRNNAVAFFFEPLIRAHDRSCVETFCYAEVFTPDAVTARLQTEADHWRPTVGLTDEEVAARIEADGIDILVDLAGHTAHNRLSVLARRPAPVQVTWLGYPNTTGLRSVDYRLVDGITDPVGAADGFASETLVRLDEGFLCYQPFSPAPEPAPPPCLQTGRITFGSFNNLSKISPSTIAVWSQLLHRVPTANLLLKSRFFGDVSSRESFLQRFAKHGISPERLMLLNGVPDIAGHLSIYHMIDVGLDPFPYNGTTTTCEALWMGVPVVTLAGDRHLARVGASLLAQVGLSDLVAGSAEEYVAIAADLAADRQRLKSLHAGLRARMASSSLCDAPRFARKIESVYRDMWRQRCQPTTDGDGIVFSLGSKSVAANFDLLAREFVSTAGNLAKTQDIESHKRLRSLRLLVVQTLLSAPFRLVEAALAGPLTEIVQSCLRSGIRSYPLVPEEAQLLELCRNDCLDAWSPEKAATSGLAGLLLSSHAYELGVLPAFDRLSAMERPIWWSFLFETPIELTEKAAAEQFPKYLLSLCQSVDRHLASSDKEEADLVKAFVDSRLFSRSYGNDTDLREVMGARAALMERILTRQGAVLDQMRINRPLRPRPRIGFIVDELGEAEETAFLRAHLERIDRRHYDVVLFSRSLPGGRAGQICRASADRHCLLPSTVRDAVARLRREDLDIMIFCANLTDANQWSFQVAAHRVASIQACTAATPTTTGLRNMDVMISGSFNEAAESQGHYSERLVCLDGCLECVPAEEKTAETLPDEKSSVPGAAAVFVSLADHDEISPELSAFWIDCLRHDEKSRLILLPFRDASSTDRGAFLIRLKQQLVEAGLPTDRMTILGGAYTRLERMSIMRSADIYLDPFPLSKGCAVYDALAAGLPIVAMRGKERRSRHASAVLEGIGLDDWSCADRTAYVGRAVRLARDSTFRAADRGRLAALQRAGLSVCDTARYAGKLDQLLGRLITAWNEKVSVPLAVESGADVRLPFTACDVIAEVALPYLRNGGSRRLIEVGGQEAAPIEPLLEDGWQATVLTRDATSQSRFDVLSAEYPGQLSFGSRQAAVGGSHPDEAVLSAVIDRLGLRDLDFMRCDLMDDDDWGLQKLEIDRIQPRLIMVEAGKQLVRQVRTRLTSLVSVLGEGGYRAIVWQLPEQDKHRPGLSLTFDAMPDLGEGERFTGGILFYRESDGEFLPSMIAWLRERGGGTRAASL